MDPLMDYFEREKKEKIERYKRLNKFVKKGETVFVGSSLMEQFPIYELMLDYGINKVIYNRGIGGFTTLELLEVMDICIFDLEPTKIFINIGTNDMNGEDYKVENLIENYEKILNEIINRLPNTKIYLMAYYPGNKEASTNPWIKKTLEIRTNERISMTNEHVNKLADKYKVKYIDVNKNLYDEKNRLKKEYTIEGMHMYGDGYESILEDLLIYINEE